MDDLELARTAAGVAASTILAAERGEARFKGAVDPVTAADLEAENQIRRMLAEARPEDRVLGEEGGGEVHAGGRTWIIDPLDGTVNFVHGIPHVAVSIALYEDGEPVVAAIKDVFRDELFEARRGDGCRVDGRLVSVSGTPRLSEGVIATGFPYDRQQRGLQYAAIVGEVLERARGIRRIGAAALDLAWVACGRFDGYWEFGLAPWDIAGGQLLIEEAGGLVSNHEGRRTTITDQVFIASNRTIHDELLAVIKGAMPPGWPEARTVAGEAR